MSNNFPDIISLVREKTSIIAEERYVEIRKVIDGAIKRCVDKYFWFIANDVFGRTSKPDLVGFEHVTWKPLSNRYLYQNPKKKNNLFWVSGSDPTDSLQTYFRSITKGSDYFPENDIIFKKDKGIVRRRKGAYAGQVFMKGEISVELGFFKTKRNPIMEHDRFGNEARAIIPALLSISDITYTRVKYPKTQPLTGKIYFLSGRSLPEANIQSGHIIAKL